MSLHATQKSAIPWPNQQAPDPPSPAPILPASETAVMRLQVAAGKMLQEPSSASGTCRGASQVQLLLLHKVQSHGPARRALPVV